eukprot:maker-scaffold249_size238305-snap-gene-0.11 protein:Tk01316 transcript:maker-scaffold249_size238305-snap-gene-0.11-mRNA-1 annotation:"Kaptin"
MSESEMPRPTSDEFNRYPAHDHQKIDFEAEGWQTSLLEKLQGIEVNFSTGSVKFQDVIPKPTDDLEPQVELQSQSSEEFDLAGSPEETSLAFERLELGPLDCLDSSQSLKEMHVFSLPNQGNIYTLSQVHHEIGSKIVVGCLNMPLHVFEFMYTNANMFDPNDIVEPLDVELALLINMPEPGCLMAVNAFCKSTHRQAYVIGVCCEDVSEDVQKRGLSKVKDKYLQVYSSPRDDPGNLEELDVSTLRLDYDPYHLSHCRIPLHNQKFPDVCETLFVLSGSDRRVHSIVENHGDQTWTEIPIGQCFPELDQVFPSVPYWTDFLYLDPCYSRRLTAVGCGCGYLFVSLLDTRQSPPKIIRSWKRVIGEGQIAKVQFFSSPLHRKRLPVPKEFMERARPDFNRDMSVYDFETFKDVPPVHILVVNTNSPSVVVKDVLQNGLAVAGTLPKSNEFDIQTSATIMDLDMDGELEIILGTYSGVLLAYKETTGPPPSTWDILWTKDLGHSIVGVDHADVTGDGVEELLTMTRSFVQVLQHDPKQIKALRLRRLKNFLQRTEHN